jgi:hypothetical protein
MANKDLFKQAIAEAKSVREAAIANAKEALEETLTPHLKDMLAAKLQEMEDKDTEEAQGNIDAHEENPTDQLEEELTFEEEGEEEEAENDSEESEDEAEEEIEVKDMEVEDLKNLIRDIIAQEMGAGEAEEMPADELPADDMVGAEDEEEIDLDELLREITEMSNEEVDEYGSSRMKEPSDAAAGGLENIVKGLQALAKKGGEIGKKAYAALEDLGAAAGSAMRNEAELEEVTEYSSELEEAMSTIEELRGQLQEVNLLNAKLLYVNKVFKANNLTESQKVSVIAAFDKAETVKEVKLVFETVANNVVVKTAKTSIKESKLGMASKATGITAKKPEVITEANEAIRRMQKLAGIIK